MPPAGAPVLEKEQQSNQAADKRDCLRCFSKTGKRPGPSHTVAWHIADEGEEQCDPHEQERRAQQQGTVDLPVLPQDECKEHKQRHFQRDHDVLDHHEVRLACLGILDCRMNRQESQGGHQHRSREEDGLADDAMEVKALLADQDELAQQEHQPGKAGDDVQVVIRIALDGFAKIEA